MPIKCFLLEPMPAAESDGGRLWRRTDTGEVIALRDAPPGAMWFATWFMNDEVPPRNFVSGGWTNNFEPSLIVRTPGGDWDVDSRAGNCTMKEDKLHRCWCRHGVAPNVTVDKNGRTCAAGGGSIICGNYHGFLQNGHLT